MKNKIFLAFLMLISFQSFSQTNSSYSIKADLLYGNILGFTAELNAMIDKPVMGGELAIEWQTMGEKNWHQYLNFPSFGISTVFLDLGNPKMLGNAFAIYPYLDISLWRTNYLKLYAKGGMGASYLTKTYYNTNQKSDGSYYPSMENTNVAIGSALNIYFAGGGGLEIPVSNGIKLVAEYTWNHCSNGSFVQPNSGINMMNGLVGIKYTPNHKTLKSPVKRELADISRKINFEFIASGGARQLYYKDNYVNGKPSDSPKFRYFPTGSLVFAAFKPLTNYYRMGVGVDAFYDGAFDGHETKFGRYYVLNNKFENKIRVGLSWQNELIFGRISAGFHFGLYLFDPLKNLSPGELAKSETLNKTLIYSYNINEEDGWFYSRAAFKYTLSKHYFISLGLKTHQQKAEFIEWGLGYRF